MRNKLVSIVIIFLFLACVSNAVSTNSVLQSDFKIVTDQRGEKVKIPQDVKRVVVLFPQAMNIVYVLGIGSSLVGFPNMKIHVEQNKGDNFYLKVAPELKNIVDVGYPGKPNMEVMVALKPDLIIGPAHYIKCTKLLKKAKIPVVSVYCGFSTIFDWFDAVKLVAECLNITPRADKYISYCKGKMAEVRKKLSDIPKTRRKKVAFLINWGNKLYIRGTRTGFAYDIINAAGGLNVFDSMNTIPQMNVSIETLYTWDPDVIIFQGFTHGNNQQKIGIENKTWWKLLRAVKNNSIYSIPYDDPYCSLTAWYSNGSFPLGLMWTAKTLYPEAFTDIDMEHEAALFYKTFYKMDYEKVKTKLSNSKRKGRIEK